MKSKGERLLEARITQSRHNAPFWECEACKAKIAAIEAEGVE